ELVASALTREAKLLDVAARLARVPEVVAGSVTSYAGGALGHDPLRVGTAARARGLTPNIPLTCARQDRRGPRKARGPQDAGGPGRPRPAQRLRPPRRLSARAPGQRRAAGRGVRS